MLVQWTSAVAPPVSIPLPLILTYLHIEKKEQAIRLLH